MIGFSPGMLATNLLFQPVALDQLTTMVVLWLALRLALGRGSWPLLGVAAGIGLETKYTIAVVLVLLIATFLVWRRDVLRSWGFPLAVAIAAALLVPNLVWEAGHGWASVHWFLEPSAERERRDAAAVHRQPDPARGGGVPGRRRRRRVARPRSRAAPARLDGRRHRRRVLRARREVVLRAAGGAVRARRRCDPARSLGDTPPSPLVGGGCSSASACSSCRSRCRCCRCTRPSELGVVKARGDYQSEVGWPAYVRLVERHAAGADVIVADNYGEAGALELFGRGLPPVASADVTMRYWRPQVAGRRALVIGYSRRAAELLQRLSRRRAHLRGRRQRRGRRADRALHAARHARRVWPSIVATQGRLGRSPFAMFDSGGPGFPSGQSQPAQPSGCDRGAAPVAASRRGGGRIGLRPSLRAPAQPVRLGAHWFSPHFDRTFDVHGGRGRLRLPAGLHTTAPNQPIPAFLLDHECSDAHQELQFRVTNPQLRPGLLFRRQDASQYLGVTVEHDHLVLASYIRTRRRILARAPVPRLGVGPHVLRVVVAQGRVTAGVWEHGRRARVQLSEPLSGRASGAPGVLVLPPLDESAGSLHVTRYLLSSRGSFRHTAPADGVRGHRDADCQREQHRRLTARRRRHPGDDPVRVVRHRELPDDSAECGAHPRSAVHGSRGHQRAGESAALLARAPGVDDQRGDGALACPQVRPAPTGLCGW